MRHTCSLVLKTRFLKPVVPGDQLHYVCEPIKLASMGGIVEAEASVDGEVVVKAQLTFAIQTPTQNDYQPLKREFCSYERDFRFKDVG